MQFPAQASDRLHVQHTKEHCPGAFLCPVTDISKKNNIKTTNRFQEANCNRDR